MKNVTIKLVRHFLNTSYNAWFALSHTIAFYIYEYVHLLRGTSVMCLNVWTLQFLGSIVPVTWHSLIGFNVILFLVYIPMGFIGNYTSCLSVQYDVGDIPR